jgi:hypothetical protein
MEKLPMKRVGIAAADRAPLMTIIKIAFVVSGLMFVYIVITIPAQLRRPVDLPVQVTLSIVALVVVALGFYAPRFFGRVPTRTTPDRPGATAVSRWTTTSLISLSFFEWSSLSGVALHFLGGRVQLVALLLAVGIISTLIWRPGAPPTAEVGKLS